MPNGDETQAMEPEPERFQAGDDGGDDGGGEEEEEGGRRLIWYFVGAALLIGVLAGALVVLLAGDDDNKVATDTAGSSSSTSSTSTSTTAASVIPPPTQAPTQQTSPPTQPQNQPKIDSFSANPNFIGCASALDNKSVTLSWTTTNATEVVLSIDGPGAYNTYQPDDSATVGYPCPSPGNQATHTYTITAKNGGAQKQQTITVSSTTPP